MKPSTPVTTTRLPRSRSASLLFVTAAAATALTLLVASAGAQRGPRGEPEALHGSKESVEKMYDFAQRHHFPFYLTPTNVDLAVASGRLVALTGDSTYELTRGVGFSYATREVRQFVTALAPQYLYACGAPLTVTSAARPLSRQPHNANPHSVHPTGIAVDIRRPPPGPCLDWIRGALARLESQGLVEATEEHHPIHLHVAVLAEPGSRVVLPNLVQGMVAAARVPSAPVALAAGTTTPGAATIVNGEVSLAPAGSRSYVVRQGDTLYDIAMRMGVGVQALEEANERAAKGRLRPGVTLVVPARGTR